ncbi:hypothetical protein Ddc_24590 [Ditylenchus destructor]|nr:hypothetical protein Ddc_24590 [Ditylenchus destructor]
MSPTGEMLPTDADKSEMFAKVQPASDILRDPKDNALLEVNNNLAKILQNPHLSNVEKYIQFDQNLKQLRTLQKERDEKLQGVSLNALGPELAKALTEQLQTSVAQTAQSTPTPNQQTVPATTSAAAPSTLGVAKGAKKRKVITPKRSQRNDSEEFTPEVSKSNTTADRGKKYEEKRMQMGNFAGEIMEHLQNNPEYYRINNEGYVLSDKGTPMKKGSIANIAQYLAGMQPERPEGAAIITKLMANNDAGKQLLTRQTGSGWHGIGNTVEKVLKRSKICNKWHYYVKWKGLTSRYNSWITRDDLE